MRRRLFLLRRSSRPCARCCGLHEAAWKGKRLAVGFAPSVARLIEAASCASPVAVARV